MTCDIKTEQVFSDLVFNQNTVNTSCSLRVQCTVPKSHEPGYLGWTLFAQLRDEQDPDLFQRQLIPVADGNDFLNRGQVIFSHPGLWKPGNYFLKVKRYSTRQLISLQEMNANWTTSEDKILLSYGFLSDVTSPLDFS